MTVKTKDTKIEKLILYPSDYFDTADQVLNDTDLTRQQKIRILKSWAFEEDRILSSEAENMTPSREMDKKENHADLLTDLKHALSELTD